MIVNTQVLVTRVEIVQIIVVVHKIMDVKITLVNMMRQFAKVVAIVKIV